MQGFRNNIREAQKLNTKYILDKMVYGNSFSHTKLSEMRNVAIFCAGRQLMNLVLLKQEMYKHLPVVMSRYTAY
jgi:hypothetical protein